MESESRRNIIVSLPDLLAVMRSHRVGWLLHNVCCSHHNWSWCPWTDIVLCRACHMTWVRQQTDRHICRIHQTAPAAHRTAKFDPRDIYGRYNPWGIIIEHCGWTLTCHDCSDCRRCCSLHAGQHPRPVSVPIRAWHHPLSVSESALRHFDWSKSYGKENKGIR